MIECLCISKHNAHISYLASIPIIERLIECLCFIKHTSHISYLASIPIIERLIECMCWPKHIPHISYITSIPIIERLIECLCSLEHSMHINYLTSIPVSYILVERRILIEHLTHMTYPRSYNSISRISICCNFCLNIIFISSNIVFLTFKHIFFSRFCTGSSFDSYSISMSIDWVWTIHFTDISSSVVLISTITDWTTFIWSTIESITWPSLSMIYICLCSECTCRTSI